MGRVVQTSRILAYFCKLKWSFGEGWAFSLHSYRESTRRCIVLLCWGQRPKLQDEEEEAGLCVPDGTHPPPPESRPRRASVTTSAITVSSRRWTVSEAGHPWGGPGPGAVKSGESLCSGGGRGRGRLAQGLLEAGVQV